MTIRVYFSEHIKNKAIKYKRACLNHTKQPRPEWEADVSFLLNLHSVYDEGLVFYVSREFYEEVLL